MLPTSQVCISIYSAEWWVETRRKLSADTPCTVVVPEGSIQSKMDAIRGYDAHLEFCAPNPQARKDTCNRIAREKDYVIVPPYDNLNVIAGQGTIGLELFEQVPDLDAVLVPTRCQDRNIDNISIYLMYLYK